MCTKFLGDDLCCGYDCYEETPMSTFEDDEDGWLNAMDELDTEWWSLDVLGILEYYDHEGFWL